MGKTAIVEGLAQRIVAADVPPGLLGSQLLELDLAALAAGCMMPGEFEVSLAGFEPGTFWEVLEVGRQASTSLSHLFFWRQASTLTIVMSICRLQHPHTLYHPPLLLFGPYPSI